jgi:alkylation response protein AidB-like acyl-CoA dehydrogenase
MAEPFTFTPEQQDLRKGVRQFLARHSGEATVRRLMDSVLGHDPATWERLGTELGVLALAVPDELGGAGGGLVDQAIAVEEFGAVLLPGPVIGTIALAVPALVAAGGEVAAELLPGMARGTRAVAFAVPDHGSEPAVTERDGRLTGELAQVVDGTSADVLLVAARTRQGVGLFAVDGAAATRTPLSTMDQTRRQAAVRLDGALVRVVAGPPDARRVIDHALATGAALLAAEQVGVAQHMLDLTVAYAKDRLQFGRPIGSFQAVKHRLADMLVLVEHARSAAYHAAWAIQDGTDDPALAASIAQAVCSNAAYRVAADAIQLHGGIGFTWEHQAHLYYKRAVTDAALLGSAAAHRDRIAALVLDAAEPDGSLVAAAG